VHELENNVLKADESLASGITNYIPVELVKFLRFD